MAAASSFRLSSTALTSVLMVLAAAITLPAGAEGSVVTLFEGPGCTGNAQVFSDLGACHNVTTSVAAGRGLRFAPRGGVSALLYTSADCSDGSLGGVLGGATRAAGGLLGAVANATDGAAGILRGLTNVVGGIAGGTPVAGADGSLLFCNGTLTFQSFKLQAGTK